MDVKDIMTRNPISIDPDAPVGTAIAVMADHRIRHLPVVEATGAVVGIVTDRDLRSAALAPALEGHLSAEARRRLRGVGRTLENLRVKDTMTWHLVTTRPDMMLTQAAALMLEKRVGSLPVLEHGTLVGIITERDALRALAAQVPAVGAIPTALW
jgi:acetoin utilization protein AcuB